MKKRRNTKTPRVPSSVTPAPLTKDYETVDSYEWVKVGCTVFFNISLVNEKFNMGTVREIRVQESGRVIIALWDDDKGMWRHMLFQDVLPQRPKGRRGPG